MTGPAVWDDRLISRPRAAALTADWPVQLDGQPGGQLLRCWHCRQAVMALGKNGQPYVVSSDGVIAAVLRHMVMAHDVALSGAGKGAGDDPGRNDARPVAGPGETGPLPPGPGRHPGRGIAGPDIPGPADQAADHR